MERGCGPSSKVSATCPGSPLPGQARGAQGRDEQGRGSRVRDRGGDQAASSSGPHQPAPQQRDAARRPAANQRPSSVGARPDPRHASRPRPARRRSGARGRAGSGRSAPARGRPAPRTRSGRPRSAPRRRTTGSGRPCRRPTRTCTDGPPRTAARAGRRCGRRRPPAVASPDAAMSAAVCSTSPTPHDPDTTRASWSRAGSPNAARSRATLGPRRCGPELRRDEQVAHRRPSGTPPASLAGGDLGRRDGQVRMPG